MSINQAPERLYTRFSTAADLDKIVSFYEEHKTPFVFPRERAVWKERAAAGAVTLIEDSAGQIVASSISYPIEIKDKQGDPQRRWTEIGSTLIALEGIGLFKSLVSAQILNAMMLETPQDGFVFEIVKSNGRSLDVFEKIGGAPFTVPQELFDVVQETFTDEGKKRDVAWYRIGTEQSGVMARNLEEVRNSPSLTSKTTGKSYILDFGKLSLFSRFEAEVRALAGGVKNSQSAGNLQRNLWGR